MLLVFKAIYYFDKNYRTYKWYQNKRGEAASGFLTAVFLTCLGIIKIIILVLKDFHSLFSWSLLIDSSFFVLGMMIFYFRSAIKLNFFSKTKAIKPKKNIVVKKHFKKGMEAK